MDKPNYFTLLCAFVESTNTKSVGIDTNKFNVLHTIQCLLLQCKDRSHMTVTFFAW